MTLARVTSIYRPRKRRCALDYMGTCRAQRKRLRRACRARNKSREEIMYTDAASIQTNSYSGYETIGIGQNSPLSSASFDINWCH